MRHAGLERFLSQHPNEELQIHVLKNVRHTQGNYTRIHIARVRDE